MKPPLDKLKPTLQAESAVAREKRAAVELNVENVRLAMYNAARAGQNSMRVKIPNDLDVRGTEAAAKFDAFFKAEGIAVSWERRPANLEDGRVVDVWEPELSWLDSKTT